jgi:tetratricopeptide (TPR) repeat protein
MRSAESHVYGKIRTGALFSMLLVGVTPYAPPAFSQQSDSPNALGRTKRMAETQHEIIMLLIRKKEYAKAASEANKIFEMKWPDDQEPLLLKELQILSREFGRNGQAAIAMKLIDRNSKCFKTTASQAEILRLKGYLYKGMGQDDESLDCFRKAMDLENKN